ncbi:MAG: DUF962 domain-containing protein [Gammaproteobacteria bacterium]|nr:DUF962 domain-containing protein [Gammaproteobacteria bacterium]MDH3749847.1 DUF962 domain-containing protein [Gammaproteobacteria bacterium]MDH3804301.1 DUF962 domain-containing protein [Gammaproteobacteria bacterium]
MTEVDNWLTRYEETHRDLTYPAVYWAAVPMVVLGTVGLLWTLPIPDEFFAISPLLNWGTAFLMAATVYYFIISVSLAIGMLPFIVGLAGVHMWLAQSEFSPLRVSIGLLFAGIIGLWLGHRNQKSLWPIVHDLQLMMIGPAWILSVLYRRIGIPF